MSLEAFLALPEVEGRCELIDGVVYMAAFPVPDHEILIMLLATHLSQSIMLTGTGIVMGTAGVVVSANSALGPDIIVIRAERNGIIGPTVLTGAPDIVVEALSSDRNRDLVDKRRLYEAAGVAEYWILDRRREHAHGPGVGRRRDVPRALGANRRRHADHAAFPGVQPALGPSVRTSGPDQTPGLARRADTSKN